MYEKYLGRVKAGLDERCGEEVLAFGLFVPRGSMMMVISPAASIAEKRQTNRAAGRKLPKSLAVAVTPMSICAFGVKSSGYTGKGSLQDEVGRWPRLGTRVETGGSVLNRLALTFPDETRLELEVMNIPVMRRINADFMRIIAEQSTPEPPNE